MKYIFLIVALVWLWVSWQNLDDKVLRFICLATVNIWIVGFLVVVLLEKRE